MNLILHGPTAKRSVPVTVYSATDRRVPAALARAALAAIGGCVESAWLDGVRPVAVRARADGALAVSWRSAGAVG